MHQLRHRAVIRHIGGGQTRHAAALGLYQRDRAALKIAGQQKQVKGVHKGGHIALHARKNHAVGQTVGLSGGTHFRLFLAGADKQQFPPHILRGHSCKNLHQKQRVFLVVQPPHKPGQAVGVGNAVVGPRGSPRGGVRVEPPGIHGVAGHGKVWFFVDMVAEHKSPRRHAAAEEIIRKQLVDAVGGPPGQRQRWVDNVAVYHDLGPGAEQPHHAADRCADLAGRVVVDDIVVAVGAQVRRQCPDAVLFIVRHRNDMHAVRFQHGGGAGLVRRALPHEQVDMVFRCIEVQQQILHIPLHPALHPKVVADH